MSFIREKTVAGLKTGDTFSVSRTFATADVIRFAQISKDFNPVHFDDRFARLKKFDGPICHGLLVATLLTEIGGQIGWLASGMVFEFKKPVYPGQTVTCDFTLVAIDPNGRARAEAIYTNESGVTVVKAVLTGILPGCAEKQIMQDMPDTAGDPISG